MAQFDVHRLGDGLVVDCQSDLLRHIASRLVVPLVPRSDAPMPAHRLNPVFEIASVDYVMVTESAGAVRTQQLGPVIESLADRSFEITGALDILISGV
jgi:toxin CcdB